MRSIRLEWAALLATLFPLTVLCAVVSSAEDGFPLRSRYNDVAVISAPDLAANLTQFVVIDVRSRLEFGVIHINNALNAPISMTTFASELKRISDGHLPTRIAFYCNGHACEKSYQAARLAASLGYTRVVAYDAGMRAWGLAYPDLSTFMGRTPIEPGALLGNDLFEARLLPFEEFSAGAQNESAILIDGREPAQRQQTPDFGDKPILNLYLAKLVNQLHAPSFQNSARDHPLYIFDAVGEQVRWLQYHLDDLGYSDYYFLEGGVWSVFKGSEIPDGSSPAAVK